jgi:hypothetical protein
MKQALWPAVTVTGLIILFLGVSQLLRGQGAVQDPLIGLKSSDIVKRQAAAEKALNDRRRLVSELLTLAQQAPNAKERRGTKELAIDLLGEYRSDEAVGPLVREIDFAPPGISLDESPLNSYPAARALIRIGEPSVQEILAYIHPDVGEKAMKLYARVIRQVDGAEAGRFRIQKALAGNITGGKKAALEQLLRVYDKNERV